MTKHETYVLPPSRIESIESEMDAIGARDWYDALVAAGTSPTLAAMFVTRKCAAIGTTDTTFNKRERNRMLQMDDGQREVITAIARKNGINTTGKTYNGQLGKYSDPHAWVSDTHDVLAAAKAKGYSLGGNGMVKVENEAPPIKRQRIAPDILDRLETERRSKDKSLDAKCLKSPKARHELREKLTEKHAPKK